MREASMYLSTALCLTSTMGVLVTLAAVRDVDFDGPLTEYTEFGADGEPESLDGALDGDHPVYASAEEFARERDVGQRSSLAGKVLIAAPDLQDPYFAGTVIYMLADDEDGALGVVINRRRDHDETQMGQTVPIYDGGPVGRDRVFVLHDALASEDSVVIGDLAVAAEPSVLEDVMKGKGPASARVFVGYAGWGPKQLDNELAHGAWLTYDTSREIVLSHEVETTKARVRSIDLVY